jgi:rhodanese-related sulfurtransferase
MENLFANIGFSSTGMFNLTPREAKEVCDKGAVLVDVRAPEMSYHKTFDVPQVIRCPKSILEETYTGLPAEAHLVFADSAGLHSREAVLFLCKKGFHNIANLAGGLVEWERDGLPLVINSSEALHGACMCMLRKSKSQT